MNNVVEHQEKVYQDAGAQTEINSGKTKAAKDGILFDKQEEKTQWSVTNGVAANELRNAQNNSAKLIQIFWRKRNSDSVYPSDRSSDKNDAITIRNRNIHRRLNPSCAADFKLLQSELIQWRDCRLEEIKTTEIDYAENGKSRREYFLTQETKILNKINELQRNSISRNRNQTIDTALEKMINPKILKLKNGRDIEVVTPKTSHEKELATLYMKLKNYAAQDGTRIASLMATKRAISGIAEGNLARDICELIDREIDMLQRGMVQHLSGHRARLSNLFLSAIRKRA